MIIQKVVENGKTHVFYNYINISCNSIICQDVNTVCFPEGWDDRFSEENA